MHAVNGAVHAVPRAGLEALRIRHSYAPPLRRGKYSLGKGMLALLFSRRRKGKRGCFIRTGRGYYVRNHGRTGSDCSGFVQHNGVHLARRLKRLPAFYQYAKLRSAPGSNHYRRWRCKAQRARAGDYKHRYEYPYRQRKVTGEHEPQYECQYCHAADRRNKVRRNGVRHARYGSL